MRTRTAAGPFAALGLPASRELTDDDVRAAWRRLAAATHPDRADGGDPARFAEAAAAYTTLRTGFGRNEALADLAVRSAGVGRSARLPRPATPRVLATSTPWLAARSLWSRVLRGRPARLAARIGGTAAFSAVVVRVAGDRPATTALVVGAVTWLGLTAYRDLEGR